MKKLMLVVAALIVAFPSVCADGSAHKRKPSRSPYAEQFQTLKKSFELDKEELSETEALEAVSVKLAATLDRAADVIAQLSARTVALENENVRLKTRLADSEKRIKDLEVRADAVDGDLDKLFAWMNKANDDLYNDVFLSRSAIGAKLDKLDGQVNNWCNGLNAQMGRLRSAVNTNSQNIQSLWNSLNFRR